MSAHMLILAYGYVFYFTYFKTLIAWDRVVQFMLIDQVEGTVSCMHNARLELKCDGTRRRTGWEVKGETGELSG